MGTPVILKIILTDGSSQRLTLSHGLPTSIDDLMVEVKKQCGLQGNFRLQFMDSLFGNEFLNLTLISEVEDKGTLKVIDMSRPITMQNDDERSSALSPVLEPQAFCPSTVNDCSSPSDGSMDTDVLSSCGSTSSRSSWPDVFHVPKFSYDAELKLQQASLAYIKNGTVLIPDPKLKSAILDGLVQEIVQYKVYVSDKEMEQVAQSLIKKYPCLTEKWSSTGCVGWKTSLKYKLSNYRTHLRKLGCQEVTVNSLKNKPVGKRSAAFGVKKAKRAEVNFCPTYPATETEESMEAMQKALLLDLKKRNNREVVKQKMEKTFAHRRHEVVRDAPMVEDFMARWPALFEVSEVRLISC
uniref:PB1 domain-containing protein n=1 Tax=Myripristis murdjan TaxID=586833 RepID=A0A667W8B2_9TELE